MNKKIDLESVFVNSESLNNFKNGYMKVIKEEEEKLRDVDGYHNPS